MGASSHNASLLRPQTPVGLAAGLLVLTTAPAHAYLDPGTGGYLFQILTTLLVSVVFFLRKSWHRLRNLLTRRRGDPSSSSSCRSL